MPRDGVVLVTDRTPNDELYQTLCASSTFHSAQGEGTLRIIGDAEAPNIIAQAVFSGHLAAREFDEDDVEETPFKVERIKI